MIHNDLNHSVSFIVWALNILSISTTLFSSNFLNAFDKLDLEIPVSLATSFLLRTHL